MSEIRMELYEICIPANQGINQRINLNPLDTGCDTDTIEASITF